MAVLGLIFLRWPPKKTNSFYGYRTQRSMQSQEAWQCANQFWPKAFLAVALLTCAFQVVAFYYLEQKTGLYAAGFLVILLLCTIPATEWFLKRNGY